MNPSLCSMDAAGRLVLPKPVRDRLNLGSGSQLEISELADGVLLRPVDARPTLTREPVPLSPGPWNACATSAWTP